MPKRTGSWALDWMLGGFCAATLIFVVLAAFSPYWEARLIFALAAAAWGGNVSIRAFVLYQERWRR